MSAMEQPALRSGSSDLLVVAGQDVGRLGHEVHPAEDDELGVGLAGGQPGEPEGVAPGVGPAHHLVALVVVAEDEDPRPERGLGRADHGGQLVVGCGRVALRKWRLKPEHVVCPLVGSASIWPAGTAWSPIRGYVGLDARLYAGNQAGTASVPPPTSDSRESGPDAVSAAHRLHPGRPGLVPVLRRRGPGPLRGQGQVPAPPAAQLLAGPGQAVPRGRPRWWPRPTTSSGWWSTARSTP